MGGARRRDARQRLPALRPGEHDRLQRISWLCFHTDGAAFQGSHRETEFQRNAGIGENLGELFELYPEWQGRPEMEPVAVPMKAGAASFHSGMTAHGAGANMTPGRRRAMTCGYMPDGDLPSRSPACALDPVYASLTL